jgi:hypothetical protein
MRAPRRKPVKSDQANFTKLNAEGFINRAGRPWSSRMVWHVLNASPQA